MPARASVAAAAAAGTDSSDCTAGFVVVDNVFVAVDKAMTTTFAAVDVAVAVADVDADSGGYTHDSGVREHLQPLVHDAVLEV